MTNRTAPLGKFVEINPESIKKSCPYDEIRYIDISSVGSGHFIESPRLLTIDEAPSRAKRIINNEDIILSMVRPNLRSFLFIQNAEYNTIASTGFAVLRAKKNADPRFIYYAVTDRRFTGYLINNAKGTSYPAVDADTVLRGEIPDFDLLRQRSIASILSAYDDLIEKNRRRIQLLEQAAQLLYKEWFVNLRFPGHEHIKINDGIPKDWMRRAAFDVMEVLSGGTPKTKIPYYWNGRIPFFTSRDTTNNVYALDTEKTLTEDGLHNCNSKLYPKDTIFITARGTVGKINLAQTDMAMNQSCYALVARPPLNQHFLYFALMESVEQFRSRAVGTVFDAIVRDTFKLISLLVPTHACIQMFSEIVSPILRQSDVLLQDIIRLAQARNLLLPRLMNGEFAI